MQLKLKKYQADFYTSTARYPCLCSGIGTGKTLMLLLKIWDYCLKYPNSLALIVRKEFTDLRDSTLKDFTRYFNVSADANKEYSFGMDLKNVLEATLERTASQSAIVGKGLRALRGGGTGAMIGNAIAGPPGAAVGGLIGTGTEALRDTTLYKTQAAALKSKAADLINPSPTPSPAPVRPALPQGWKFDAFGRPVKARPTYTDLVRNFR